LDLRVSGAVAPSAAGRPAFSRHVLYVSSPYLTAAIRASLVSMTASAIEDVPRGMGCREQPFAELRAARRPLLVGDEPRDPDLAHTPDPSLSRVLSRSAGSQPADSEDAAATGASN
jgi:hypothetical protein